MVIEYLSARYLPSRMADIVRLILMTHHQCHVALVRPVINASIGAVAVVWDSLMLMLWIALHS